MKLYIVICLIDFDIIVFKVAHPLVQEQLMEYLYQGFLVPVLGPALHQVFIYLFLIALQN